MPPRGAVQSTVPDANPAFMSSCLFADGSRGRRGQIDLAPLNRQCRKTDPHLPPKTRPINPARVGASPATTSSIPRPRCWCTEPNGRFSAPGKRCARPKMGTRASCAASLSPARCNCTNTDEHDAISRNP